MKIGRRERGFSVLEALIVVVLAAMAIAAAAVAARYWSKEARRDRTTAEAARTFGALADAVVRYGQAHPEAFTATPREVPLTELVAAGAWPAGAPTETPWAQPLAVLARTGPNGVESIVIEKGEQPDSGALLGMGINELPRIEELKRAVAMQLAATQRAAGVVATGASEVVGALGTFHKDVSAFATATADTLPASWPAIAVLSGFTDLTPDSGEDAIDIEIPIGGSLDLTGCTLVPPSAVHGAPVCPTGTREIARWPYCGHRNPNFPPYVAYPSDAGTVTVGLVRNTISGEKSVCKANDFWPTWCNKRMDESLTAEALIHGGRFGGEICEITRYGHKAVDGSGNVIPPGDCNTSIEGVQLGILCSTTATPDDIYALGTDSVNLLCCAQP